MEELNEKLHMKLLNFNASKRTEWVKNRKPFSVLFELTSSCNMNCIHCYLQHNHVPSVLDYDDVIRILDILYEKGILFITFTGGEILTRSDFLDIYLYAKKKGFLVELFTNGYLFTDKIIDLLSEYPPLLVDVSIYGACEETYFKVTRIRGAFERVIKNCRKLKDAGVRVSLKSPIIIPTLSEIHEMETLADCLGIEFVYTFDISPTIDKDEMPRSLQVPMKTSLAHEFKNYYEQVEAGKREQFVSSDIKKQLKLSDKIYACNVALNSFVIDYQGKMCPCMKLRHRGVKLTSDNYDQIWQDFKKYSDYIASDNYKCRKCDARYYCDVCPAEMDLLYDDMEYRPDAVCKIAHIRRKFYEKEITCDEAIQLAFADDNK